MAGNDLVNVHIEQNMDLDNAVDDLHQVIDPVELLEYDSDDAEQLANFEVDDDEDDDLTEDLELEESLTNYDGDLVLKVIKVRYSSLGEPLYVWGYAPPFPHLRRFAVIANNKTFYLEGEEAAEWDTSSMNANVGVSTL